MHDNFDSFYKNLRSHETTALPQGLKFIGDVANQVGITPVTIRFYEKEGLLSPQRIGRFRAYGPEQEVQLRMIAEMRSMGISIVQIKEMFQSLSARSADDAREFYRSILSKHLDELHERHERIARETEITRERLFRLSNRSVAADSNLHQFF
jgi:DNA-binding transcriptional MerR regulator